MSRQRRNFSAKFKSDLVIELLKGEKDLNTLAVENNIIEVKPWASKPQFVGYYDGDIRVGYNESFVTFQFNTSAKDIINMNMILPLGGTVFNCSSITYQINGQNIYTKKCNVTATKTGNAIFEYDIFGQRVTIPKELEIVEYSSSYYLIYSIIYFILLFSIFL